ncbi:MAG: hypothetical protein JJV93_03215 [Alphaproteobacteria bacterium]|nr:hypothetical protein [Alphaproteobacteria bacterium]MBL0718237.1 hypothetical protein [Alphaproteobacteria bacterium]
MNQSFKIPWMPHIRLGWVLPFISMLFFIGVSTFWLGFPLMVLEVLKSDGLIGLFYALLSLVSIIVSLFITYLLHKWKSLNIQIYSLIGMSILIVIISLVPVGPIILWLEILRNILSTITYFLFSLLMIEIAKNESDMLKIEGHSFLLSNIAWVIGPLIAGGIIAISNQFILFQVSAFLTLLSSILLLSFHHPILKRLITVNKGNKEDTGKKIHSFKDNLIDYFRDKELAKLFLLTLPVQLIFITFGVYLTLMLNSLGYTLAMIGIIGGLRILPCVFIEGWILKLTKRWHFKSLLWLAVILMGTFTIVLGFGFIANSAIIIMSSLLIATIGIAIYEPLREVYFFKNCLPEDRERFNTIHRLGPQLVGVFGVILAGGILMIDKSMVSLYFIFGLLILSSLTIVHRLKY